MADITTQFLSGALVGAIASIAANAVWSMVTAPKLIVRAPLRTSAQGSAHFWGTRVEMAPAIPFPRHPALAVQASLNLRDPYTGDVITGFTCRWRGTPQPVVPTGPDKYVPNIAGIPIGQRGEVYQHKSEAIDLFVKFDGEAEFYGFPNEAYFHGLKHPDFKFDDRFYLATLAVRHDRDEHELDLEIHNPSTAAAEFSVTVKDQRYRSIFGNEWKVVAA